MVFSETVHVFTSCCYLYSLKRHWTRESSMMCLSSQHIHLGRSWDHGHETLCFECSTSQTGLQQLTLSCYSGCQPTLSQLDSSLLFYRFESYGRMCSYKRSKTTFLCLFYTSNNLHCNMYPNDILCCMVSKWCHCDFAFMFVLKYSGTTI